MCAMTLKVHLTSLFTLKMAWFFETTILYPI